MSARCTCWAALAMCALAAWMIALPAPARAQDDELKPEQDSDDSASMSFDSAEADELEAEGEAGTEAGSEAAEETETDSGAETEGDVAADVDVAADTESSNEDSAAEDAEPEPEPKAAEFRAEVGFGMGMLELSRPTALVRQTLPRSVFAAVAIEFGLHLKPQNKVSYDVWIGYHSSLGLVLETEPLFGLDQRAEARNQRVELGFAPILRLGSSPRAWSLSWPIGFVLRALTPKLHQFGLPDLLLAGPELRMELTIPLGDIARLRLAPELIWLVYVDPSLRDQGACCQGVAAGGVGSLEADLGSTFRVALDYRESHAFVGSGERAYDDMERYLTAALTGRF